VGVVGVDDGDARIDLNLKQPQKSSQHYMNSIFMRQS
jgi:hypothetical protein